MNNQQIFEIVNKTTDSQIKSAITGGRFYPNHRNKRITKKQVDLTLNDFDINSFLNGKHKGYLYELSDPKYVGNKLIFYKISRLCEFLVEFYRLRHRDYNSFNYSYWFSFINNMMRAPNEDPSNILLVAYDYYKDDIIKNCIEYAENTINTNKLLLEKSDNPKIQEYRQKVAELDELFQSISGQTLDSKIKETIEIDNDEYYGSYWDTTTTNLIDLANPYDTVPNRTEIQQQNKSLEKFLEFIKSL